MKRLFAVAFATWLLSTGFAGAANPPAFDLYLAGKYDDAIAAGIAMNNGAGFAIAARSVLADAVMQAKPCLKCMKRAEGLARRALAADPQLPDAHVMLAVSLGYEARIVGPVYAKLNAYPEEAKKELDAALKLNADNVWALGALGGWNIEIIRTGGERLGYWIYGATVKDGLDQFAHAVRVAPDNVVLRYQIALSLGGFDRKTYQKEIATSLTRCIAAKPVSAYDRYAQGRARDLQTALAKNDVETFDRIVKHDQGYP